MQISVKKIALIFFFFFLVAYFIFSNWFKGFTKKIFINQNPTYKNIIEEHMQKKTAFNLVLLGYGGTKHDGTYLTDTVILLNINPNLQKNTLISIPRDLWVKLPVTKDGVYYKINAAYAIGIDNSVYQNRPDRFKGEAGGGNLVKYILSEVTGQNIERFIAIDFDGFKNAIDAVDGIDVKIEKTFDDYEYPVDGKENELCGKTEADLPELIKIATNSPALAFPCRYEKLHFDAGISHLNGDQALKFVRSRHSLQDGTDFGRSTRQRNLLEAVKDKVLTLGFIPKIPEVANSLKDNVRTDLTPDEAKTLLQYATVLGKYKNENFALTNQDYLTEGFSDNGQYVLIPKSGKDQWLEVKTALSNIINPPTLTPRFPQSP